MADTGDRLGVKVESSIDNTKNVKLYAERIEWIRKWKYLHRCVG